MAVGTPTGSVRVGGSLLAAISGFVVSGHEGASRGSVGLDDAHMIQHAADLLAKGTHPDDPVLAQQRRWWRSIRLRQALPTLGAKAVTFASVRDIAIA
jgi:hypothetical protein